MSLKRLTKKTAVLLAMSMLLTGCGKKEENVKEITESVKTEAKSTENTTASTDTENTADSKNTENTSDPANTDNTENGSTEENKDKIADASETVEAEKVTDANMSPITADMLNDGEYEIDVNSSSSMFKISKAILKVADGKLTVTMTMGGKGYLYIYKGTPEEAVAAKEDEYIPFAEDSDGAHTYTFDIDALDVEVKCAAFSKKKEKWYDRSLCFTSSKLPVSAFKEDSLVTAGTLQLADGKYEVEFGFDGGSGKVSLENPAEMEVKDGQVSVTLKWLSTNYDYMIVDDIKYDAVVDEQYSVFTIPVAAFDKRIAVIADTTAMSKPHEIAYSFRFISSSIKSLN
ncbi:hypothetical protein SAMN04487934_1087 [Eubacterium ruminantium]|nr:hypothetical protein SAMN04487934_1087 [Eubacterium ruminantium]